jgi:hypothetical protein
MILVFQGVIWILDLEKEAGWDDRPISPRVQSSW